MQSGIAVTPLLDDWMTWPWSSGPGGTTGRLFA